MGVPFKSTLQTPAEQTERRANPRHKVHKSGVVTCKFSEQNYACWIVNLSAAGATIETPSYAALTKSVTLLVIGEKIVFSAEVVWKNNNLVGLKFIGEPNTL